MIAEQAIRFIVENPNLIPKPQQIWENIWVDIQAFGKLQAYFDSSNKNNKENSFTSIED